MHRQRFTAFLVLLFAATACASGSSVAEEPPSAPTDAANTTTSALPDLAFTDTTPITPVLDEGAAQTCFHVRDAIDALAVGDPDGAANALTAASFYIASTETPGFASHLQSLVLLATTEVLDTNQLEPITELCATLLAE